MRLAGPQALTLAHQARAMFELWPEFDTGLHRGALHVRGSLQPTPLSAIYSIRLEYRVDCLPGPVVDRPRLERRNGQKIPHVYRGDRPCLFYPGYRNWHSGKLVARTIIPWMSLWLYHYEMWHATGDWQGGGKHPR